jgi:hypothetical protein
METVTMEYREELNVPTLRHLAWLVSAAKTEHVESDSEPSSGLQGCGSVGSPVILAE